MANRAFRVCSHPGCGALTKQTRCPAHQVAQRNARLRYDRDRNKDERIRFLNNSPMWRKGTRLEVLRRDRLCVMCNSAFSEVVDHIIDANTYIAQHGGDESAYFDVSNLRGICKPCHGGKTAQLDGGFGNVRRI